MRSRVSDRIAIDGPGEEATWQREKRPITRGIKAVDLHLSEGGHMAHHDSSANHFLNDLIRAVDQRSYNGLD